MSSDAYAGKVKVYETVVDRLNKPIHAIAFKMVPGEEGLRVLDVGCGTGAQLKRYVDAGCMASGVDLSPSMLEAAKKHLGSEVDLRLADATALPYEDDTFDIVLCSMFLHELDPDTRSLVVGEVARVLKPDGRNVIVEFDSEPRTSLSAKFRRAISLVFERIAGSEHHRNFKQFLASGGVTAELATTALTIEEVKTFRKGDLAVYGARPTPGIE